MWWDEPKAVSATIELRDMDAKAVAKLKHDKGQKQEKLGPTKLAAGTYFVRIQASSGASVYSYEIVAGTAESPDASPDL